MSTKEKKQLGHLIEQKILEFFGDPDSGLALKKNFRANLQKRARETQKLTAHSTVLKKYGVS